MALVRHCNFEEQMREMSNWTLMLSVSWNRRSSPDIKTFSSLMCSLKLSWLWVSQLDYGDISWDLKLFHAWNIQAWFQPTITMWCCMCKGEFGTETQLICTNWCVALFFPCYEMGFETFLLQIYTFWVITNNSAIQNIKLNKNRILL
jgi:hypothetical protein